MELVKNHTSGAPFRGPKHGDTFGNYGSLVGNALKMEHIKLLSTEERRGRLKSISMQNKGDENDRALAIKLGKDFPCLRKRLLTREVTCKENPHQLYKKMDLRIKCPEEELLCAYKYPKALANHLMKKHHKGQASGLLPRVKAFFDAKASTECHIRAQDSQTRQEMSPGKILELTDEGEESNLHLVLYDLETTSLRKDTQIVSLTFLDLTNESIHSTLIRPDIPIHPEASKIHGIQNFHSIPWMLCLTISRCQKEEHMRSRKT